MTDAVEILITSGALLAGAVLGMIPAVQRRVQPAWNLLYKQTRRIADRIQERMP